MDYLASIFKKLCGQRYEGALAATFCGNLVRLSLQSGYSDLWEELLDSITVCIDHNKVNHLQMRILRELCPELVKVANPARSKELTFELFFLRIAEYY